MPANLARSIKRSWIYWRFGANLRAPLRYFVGGRQYLNDEVRRLVAELDSNGIAVTSADRLLENEVVQELNRRRANCW